MRNTHVAKGQGWDSNSALIGPQSYLPLQWPQATPPPAQGRVPHPGLRDPALQPYLHWGVSASSPGHSEQDPGGPGPAWEWNAPAREANAEARACEGSERLAG